VKMIYVRHIFVRCKTYRFCQTKQSST